MHGHGGVRYKPGGGQPPGHPQESTQASGYNKGPWRSRDASPEGQAAFLVTVDVTGRETEL